MMQIPDQHIETLKHVGDITSFGAVLMFWIGVAAKVAAPLAIIIGLISTTASAVWFTFRAIDAYDNWEEKRLKRRVAKMTANEVPGHPSV